MAARSWMKRCKGSARRWRTMFWALVGFGASVVLTSVAIVAESLPPQDRRAAANPEIRVRVALTGLGIDLS